MNLTYSKLITMPLETNAFKEEAVVAIGEWSPQTGKKQEETPSQSKRRHHEYNPRKRRNGDTPLCYSGRTTLTRQRRRTFNS
jgi:hypothetical protein